MRVASQLLVRSFQGASDAADFAEAELGDALVELCTVMVELQQAAKGVHATTRARLRATTRASPATPGSRRRVLPQLCRCCAAR